MQRPLAKAVNILPFYFFPPETATCCKPRDNHFFLCQFGYRVPQKFVVPIQTLHCRWDSNHSNQIYKALPTSEVLEMEELDCHQNRRESCGDCEQKPSRFLSIESPSGRTPLSSILDAAPTPQSKLQSRLVPQYQESRACYKCRGGEQFRGPLDGLMQDLVGPKTTTAFSTTDDNSYY